MRMEALVETAPQLAPFVHPTRSAEKKTDSFLRRGAAQEQQAARVCGEAVLCDVRKDR